MFPRTCAITASLSEPTRAGNRHKMPTRSPSVDIPSKAIGLPGIMFATLGVSPVGHLGPNPYHPSPKVTIRKLLELISEFSNVTGYKTNTQKSPAFLYTNNETSEREIKELISFTIATE